MKDTGIREAVAWIIEVKLVHDDGAAYSEENTGMRLGEWKYSEIVYGNEKPNKPPSPNGFFEYRSRALVFRASTPEASPPAGENVTGVSAHDGGVKKSTPGGLTEAVDELRSIMDGVELGPADFSTSPAVTERGEPSLVDQVVIDGHKKAVAQEMCCKDHVAPASPEGVETETYRVSGGSPSHGKSAFPGVDTSGDTGKGT